MKLVNKKEFLKMHEGAVYFEKVKDPSDAMWLGCLHIKGESCGDVDFFNIDLLNPLLSPEMNEEIFKSFERLDNGENLKIDFNCSGRDGMYDDTDMYYVLDKDDVKSLLDVITEAYKTY